MPPKQIAVVGRPFARFAAQAGAFTVETALAALRGAGFADDWIELVPGQGLTASEWAAIEAAAADKPEVTAAPYPRVRLARDGLHKRDERNVLIGDLRRTGDRSWRAELIVHAEDAVLADRDNGTGHVPGMVEIEAGVQMAMGVTERYLLPEQGRFTFVTGEMGIELQTFLFPLRAHVELVAERVEWRRPEVLDLELTAAIVQGGSRVMSVRFQSRAYESRYLESIETDRARNALRTTTSEENTLEHR